MPWRSRNAFSCESDQLGRVRIVLFYSDGERCFLRVKDPFLCVVEVIRDLVCSMAQRLLDSIVPVGLDQVLEILAVGRSRVGDIWRAV